MILDNKKSLATNKANNVQTTRLYKQTDGEICSFCIYNYSKFKRYKQEVKGAVMYE